MQAAQQTAYRGVQYPAPYAPQGAYAVSTNGTSMTEMLNAMMPIIMLVMLMGMMMPMMKGLTAK